MPEQPSAVAPKRPRCPECWSDGVLHYLHREMYEFAGPGIFYQCADTGCCGFFEWENGELGRVYPCDDPELLEEQDA